MKRLITLTACAVFFLQGVGFAQNVGIANVTFTPDDQAILEIQSTEKGVLLPRMTTLEAAALGTAMNAADEGMMVYDTDIGQYKYWDGSSWRLLITDGVLEARTLDDAYDAGGSGGGRTIVGDAGSLQVTGTGGGVALQTDGSIQLTADDTWIGAGSTIERIEFDKSLDRIDIEDADLTIDSDRWIGIDGSSPRIEFESGRLNMQDADIEVDDDAWIGLNASNPRILFDTSDDRVEIKDADIQIDGGQWFGVGSTVERISFENTDNEINILGVDAVGIGTASPGSTLDVSGKTETTQLEVGGGTTFNSIQGGTATLGSGSNVAVYTITFPTAFSSAPNVVCTPRTETGQTYNDTFSVTVKSVTTTGFTVNIDRTDSGGTSWGQSLLLGWFAFQ